MPRTGPFAPALANDSTVPVAQVGGYDLVWCGGPVKGPKGAPNAGHSNLGSSNLRETNLRQLSKAAMLARKACGVQVPALLSRGNAPATGGAAA